MKTFNYTDLTLDQLIDKIKISNFFNLPRMVSEALKKLKNTSITSSIEYTTNEVKIGTYLGEDLYQITIQTPVIINNTSGNLSLFQCDKLISVEVTNNIETVPTTIRGITNGSDSINPVLSITNSNGNIILEWVNYSYITKELYITLRYTK